MTDETAKVVQPDQRLLEVRDLSTDFIMKRGTVHAVDDVSFTLDAGKILAIVGESGSGKSVCSLSVMRLLQHPGKVTAGEIIYKGDNILNYSKTRMRHIRGNDISMIFQEPMTSLNPVFTVEDQLCETIRLHMKDLSKKEVRAHAIEMLHLVGIPSPEKRIKDYPHQMSGGMRQRVMIAMALSCDPELLIADEPTTALDVTIQAQILDLIGSLRDKIGMAVLLITHDLGVVSEVADEVVVMYCGQIVEQASAHELFEVGPMHPYTFGLLKSIPTLDNEESGPLYMIPGMVPNPLNLPRGCKFAPRCPYATERCHTDEPPTYEVGDRKLRCFIYDPEDPLDAEVGA
ncbi:MAG: ABC transporter ATP-binding protein [Coriobacteriia bacterium]|nr:ABC transporter ATP-binding protein [Coriobacteriia bacterium]